MVHHHVKDIFFSSRRQHTRWTGDWSSDVCSSDLKQKGGKIVHAWAFEGDLPEPFEVKSNLFEMEWPPRSGKLKEFPEVDRAEFFTEDIARRKMKPAQTPFLDRLRAAVLPSTDPV